MRHSTPCVLCADYPLCGTDAPGHDPDACKLCQRISAKLDRPHDDCANALTHAIHEADAERIAPGLHSIALPHHAYMLTALDTTTLVHLRTLTPRTCIVHGPDAPAGCCGVDLDVFNTDVDTLDSRVALVVALVGDALHEALEWCRDERGPVVDPHSTSGEVLTSLVHVFLAAELTKLGDSHDQ